MDLIQLRNDFIKSLPGGSAQSILSAALELFGNRVALASSFSIEDQVVLDLMVKLRARPRVFTLDTGRLPQQTYDLIEKTRKHYSIDVEILFPDAAQVEEMVNEHGPNLFLNSVEQRKLCCRVRKIEPLKRRLAGLDAWICGLRSEQSTTRSALEIVEADFSFGLLKISPLADWTEEKLRDYVKANGVPYNPLHDEGYPSIGCACCTRAIKAGEDIRAGRWWWEKPEHKECGLHLKSN
ncbi:MAG: phosphoadenylyl-sulfate reductase [Phycisphaerae bacterium]|jgi:phosphoadenosine phosphosulfate reductase